jgi:hypothetical protein
MPQEELPVGMLVYEESWYNVWCWDCYSAYANYMKVRVKEGSAMAWPLYINHLGPFSQDCDYCGREFHQGKISQYLFESREYLVCEDEDCDGDCETGYVDYLDPSLFPSNFVGEEHPTSILPEV